VAKHGVDHDVNHDDQVTLIHALANEHWNARHDGHRDAVHGFTHDLHDEQDGLHGVFLLVLLILSMLPLQLIFTHKLIFLILIFNQIPT
jgi:hypothetical protein